jgi:ABC-type dipeptide/oligopeptide/nickel transport system permease component
MKSSTQKQANHPSYRRHRRQVWTQILLPILVVVAVVIAAIVLASLATFRNGTDPGRWVAISTIWLAIPLLLAGLLVIVVLAASAFMLAWVAGILPEYSFRAQTATRRVESAVKRGGEMIRQPGLALRSAANRIRGLLPGKAERIGKQ